MVAKEEEPWLLRKRSHVGVARKEESRGKLLGRRSYVGKGDYFLRGGRKGGAESVVAYLWCVWLQKGVCTAGCHVCGAFGQQRVHGRKVLFVGAMRIALVARGE